MPYADINGIKLYWEMHGESGDALVLAHGYTGDVTDWHHQIAAFSSTYRVLVVEHRGHGRSEAPSDRSLYRIPLMAEDLLALADAAGLGRFHLAGHSMGGGIVQEAALTAQERLLSLTLEGTSCKFNLNADPQMAAWRDRRLHLARTEGMAAVAREPLIAPLPPHMPPERAREEADRLGRMSPDAFVGAAEGLLGWEGTEERAARITVPTLIVFGDLDSEMIISGSLRLEKLLPNVTVEVIPEAGHSPQWERPEIFNRVLAQFLASAA